MSVWSGKIELKSLSLKANALQDLNLPLVIKRGVLQNLKLQIPWASLGSKPVVVNIDGLLAQVEPYDIDPSTVDADTIKQLLGQFRNIRRKLLEGVEKNCYERLVKESQDSGMDEAATLESNKEDIV